MPVFDGQDAGVPQSDSDAIARRLLGDDLVNRYGDVIGTRKPGAADALRDFTVAFSHGQAKADELKMKVQENYREAYTTAQRNAIAAKQADIDKSKAVLDAIKTVQSLPPGQRAGVLKETLDSMGLPHSAAAIKMFTDSDHYAMLPMDILETAASDGTLSTEQISGVFGSALNAAKFMAETARKKRDQQTTGNMVLRAEDQKIKARLDKLKLQREKQFGVMRDRLSIKNATLDAKIKEKNLAKKAAVDPFEALLAESEGPTPADVVTPAAGVAIPQPAPGPAATPPAVVESGASDVSKAKTLLGLK